MNDKEKQRAYDREYYCKNREKKREQYLRYKAKNRERIRARDRQFYQDNIEDERQRAKEKDARTRADPERYEKWKANHRKYASRKWYGEYWEAHRFLIDIERELMQQATRGS